ncbi:MBG domain-containing protein [Edaphobacter aggregans]
MSCGIAGAQTPTTVSLSVTPVTASYGSVVQMTATVTAGATHPSAGTVTFSDTFNTVTHVLGTIQVQSANGKAILQRELGGIGNHSITATFNAPKTYQSSSSTAQIVAITGQYPTTASLLQTGGATGNWSLTATITGTGSLSLSPGGNVSLLDTSNGGYLLGMAGLGTGTIAQQTVAGAGSPIGVGTNPESVAVGDFNGDGFIDIAVLSKSNNNNVSILLGDGTGAFTELGTKLNAGNNPVAVVTGDFDGDGNLDLAVTNSTSNAISILLGNGDGTFRNRATFTVTTPYALAIGDFNRDGIPDLAVANSGNQVNIMLGNGSGGFTLSSGSPFTVGNGVASIVVGDFNRDGNLDFATANQTDNSISVMQGDGTGTVFTSITGASLSLGAGTTPLSIVTADFDGDNKLDLAVAESGKNRIGVLRGNGDGTFGLQATYATGSTPYALAVGDFNADGNYDIGVANSGATTASILLGNGNGTFQSQTTPSVGTNPRSVAAADFDGDGNVDLAVANYGSNNVSILLNQITDTATASLTMISIPGGGNHLLDATYAGDTNFSTSTSNKVSLAASPITTSTLLSTSSNSPTYGQQVVLTATLSTSMVGTLTPAGVDTVTFKDGTTTIGTSTLSSGVATLNVSNLSVGSHTITAVFGGDSNFQTSTSAPVSIVVGTATPVITWANPAPIAYGTLLSTTQLNAVASVNGITVPGTYTYTPAAGTLLATGSPHTLSVTFKPTASGNYTTATASVSLTVTQATPIISWATPSPIAFGTPLSNVQLNATVTSTTVVPLSSYYNVSGIITDGSTVTNGGFDANGNDYSANQLGTSISWNGVTYTFGPVNANDAVSNITINLPQGHFSSLNMLGALVNNATASNTFTVTYTDGSTKNFTQSLSDWVYPMNYAGESNLKCDIARDQSGGAQDTHSTCVYGYQFALDSTKIVQSVTLPNTRNIVMLAMGLTSPPIAGTMVYSPAADTVPAVGTDTLSVTFTPTDTVDYSSASATVQLVVNPATAYLNWPTPAPISYGTPLSSTQLNASAVTATGVIPVPISTYYRVSAFFTDGVQYQVGGFDNNGNAYSANQLGTTIAFNGINFALGPPSVPNSITSTTVLLPQGNFTTLSFIGAAANSAQTNQTFTVNYTDGTSTTAQISLSSWTASSGFAGETIVSTTTKEDTSGGSQVVGTYNLYGYQIALSNTKTVSSITLPNNLNVVVLGMALSTSSSATNPIPGTYAYTPASGTILSLGTHTLSVTFTPTDTSHYSVATKTVSIVVNKAVLTVTANSQSVVYGTSLAPYTYAITGFVNGDTQTSATTGTPSLTTNPTTPSNVNTYPITVAAGTLASSNYSFTFVNGSVVITPATLTLNANNASRFYNTANPTFTGTISGAVNGDTFTESFSTTANTSSAVGTYPITPAASGTHLSNYTLAVNPGTLTVTQATLTVTAGNASRAYGAPNPVLTASGAGALSSDSFTYTATTAAVPSSPLGTYSIVPAVTGANLGNYNVVYVDGTLTVGQATLTVTAGNASRAYGAPNPVLTASGAGALSSDSFTYTATTVAVPSSPLGTYSIVPAVTGANLGNYNVVYVDGTLTVGQATLTVTAGNASRAYGAPNPVLTASGAGALSSDSFTYTATTAAVPSSPLGTYSIVPAVTGANLGNYNVVYVNGTLTVGQATLTVTAGNASRAYGAPNPVLTASGSGVQNGDSFTYTATTAAVPSSPLGTYSIVPAVTGANLGNYNVVYVNGTLTVGQATLTVTAGNASRAYGAPNPVLTASGSGVQNGDSFTYTATTAAVPSSPLGTYSIVPAVTGANLANYNVVYVNGTLTVGQATLTVTAGNASRAYGAPNPVLTASGAGALSSDSFTYTATTAAVPSSPLGTYSIVPAVTGANLANYNVVYVNGTLTVGQATLTVTAGNASRAYGAPNPVLTASGAGALSSDSFTYTATTAAVPSSPLGTYSIVPAVTGANLGNYNVVYVNGTLTVGQATLTVTAGNASRAYGAPNPVLTASGAGALSSDSFTYTATTAAVPSSPLGTYSIVPAVTGANLGNYNVVYVDGTLTVGQATLTVTAGNASRAYGAPNPVLTASGAGALSSDSFTYTATTAAVPSSPLGTYSIVPAVTGANLANYNVVYVDGTLTVGQATLTVTAGNASRAYGAPNPVLTASGAGALSSDSFTYTATTAAVPSSPLGTYSIVPAVTGANLGNYNVVYVNGTLTVGQATLTVTAGNASRAYGAPNPVLTASGSGVQNGDSFTYTATTAAVPSSPLGTYSIVPAVTGANLANYNVVYVNGTLTVGQATLTVTAGNASRAYGAPNPVLTASGSGVQNGDSFTYTATTAAVPSSPLGTYSIVPAVTGANLGNYNVVYVDGTLTVGQATLTVTAGNASRAYGAPNPVLTASGAGALSSDSFTYTATTAAVPSSPLGTYSIVPAVTGANLGNYNVVYVDGTLTVGQATLTVTSGNASRAYGAPNPVLTASGSGVQNGDSFTYTATTAAVPSSPLGTYSIVPAVTGANLGNYNVVYVDGTLTVGQATLTVTAGNASRAYGAPNPVLTASGAGALSSDSFTYTATTAAVPSSPLGTYSIVPAVTGANLANYNVVYVNGTLTVGQATLTVTAGNASRAYGAPNPVLTASGAGALSSDSFTYTATTAAVPSSPLGTYSIVPAVTGANLANYNVVYVNGTLTVGQATLTVTAGNASRAYGAPNPVLTASGSGVQNGDSFTYTATTAAVPSSPLGTYSIVPAVTGANLGNYNVVYVDGTLTVGQATLTVTAGNASRAYGAPNPVLTASGSGVQNGDSFTYTATTVAVPSSPLGTYSIVPAVTGANLGNYNVVYVDGTLTVGQATLTVTAGNASRAYGAPNPVLTASGAGALSSDSFTYTATTAAVPSSPLGTYSIVPAVTGANLGNYNVVYVDGTLTVGQATLTVTAGNASRAYGAPNPVLTASGAGALSSDSFTYTATTAAVPSSPLGTYSIVPAVTGANLANYNVVYVNGTLTVGQATLTVTAGNASRAYGAPNPVLTASGSGVQNGDSFTYTATTAAVPSSPLGTYSIVPAVTGANLANYNVVYVDGTLTVGQATLTVTAGNASRAYGAPNPVLTASGAGALSSDSFTYTATTAAVPSSPLGTYSIVPAVTGANLGNYNVVYVDGTLTVGQATLTVTAGNASRAYGAPNPVLTASGAGALSSDSFTYTATTAAVPSSPLGTYSIVPAVTGANLGNYNVVYVDGTLTVGQATLTVTSGNASRAYGAPNPVLTASGAGALSSDSFTYTATTAAVPSSPLGTYSIVPAVTGANLGNYNVVYVNGTLTVGQATLTVTAGNASRAYGAPNPVLTASGSGVQNGDSFTYTATTAAVPSSPLGTYSIVPAVTGANLANYNVVYVNGTLTVGQATLTVTAGNASRAYGAPNPVLTASGAGALSSDSFTYTATTAAVPSSPLGTYSIVPAVTGANLANYNVVYVNGTLTVGQATLTVTAGNASRAYGAPNPVLTASGAGALSSDSFTYTATTAAVPSSPLGTYSIVPAVTGANLANYNVVYVNGTLTVGQATLTVTAGNASRAYGAPNPVLTASGSGVQNGDSFTYTATTAAVPSSPLGTYSIVPAVTGANLGNYNVVYVDGTLTVGQATLTVTAGNASRAYGAPNPVLTASGSGVQNGDSFTYTATTAAVPSSPLGTYSIVPAVTGANLGNYNVVYVDGTLTVGQATLTVTAGNASRAYGAPNPVLTASGAGALSSDSFTYTATTAAVPSSPLGTYSIVPAVTGANLGNYNVVYVDGTLTVGQATLTVTAGNASRAYGAPNPVLTASGAGALSSDSFTYTATTAAVPSSPLGTYSIVPAVTGANLANYNVVYVNGTLTVGQATLTVTAGNASRAYGAPNPVLTASGAGALSSDSFTYTATTAAVPSSPLGTYSIVPAVTGANLGNYNVVYVNGTLTVGQATLTVTAGNASRAYGAPNPVLTASGAGALSSDSFTYTATTAAVPSSPLGTYSIVPAVTGANLGNYNVVYVDGTLTVGQATLTVTAGNASRAYGAPNPVLTASGAGALSSDSFTYTATTAAVPSSPLGTYSIVPAVTGANLANYNVVYVNGTLTVGQATLTVTAGNASRAYGAPNPVLTASGAGALSSDSFTYTATTAAVPSSPLGTYSIVPAVTGANLGNYNVVYVNGTLTVGQATLTVTAGNASRAYGAPNPVLTASGSGVQNGDSFTYTATTAAVPSSPLGTYSIVPAVTGANLANYNVVYVDGTLTVGQATLTVTAGNASRAYGAPNPVLTASGAGALSSDSFTYTATTAAVPSSPLGTYSIVPAVTGANLANYNVVYVNGTLTVGQATLTVTAGNASRAYGAPNPVLTASGAGALSSDSFTYTATTAAVPSSPLGTYSIVPAVTGANLGNYNVVYVNGTLTVGQATLTVTAGNASRAYGAPNPVLTASGAGALSSDSFTYTATTAAVPSSPLGTYSIVPAVTGANLANYNVVYVDGTLTVGQATLTVTAGNASRAYGAPNPVLTASGAGALSSDSFTYTATTVAVPSSPLGTYSIVPAVTGANLANYNVVYVDGTLTVGQATLTVTAGNASRAYGAPNPVLTASGAGALSSDSFTYTATTAAVPSSPLGTYSIVPAVTGANLANYNVVYVNGTLTVGQATLTVTAGNASRAYGAPNPVLTASGAGALSSDSFTYTATTAAVPSSPLGTYSIVPAVTGANLANYNVVYVNGTLTVGQATLTVTAGNASRAYGAPNPVLTASGSGVQNGDSFTYTATTAAVPSSPLGTYSIVPAVTGANLGNYNVVYVDGTLTVGQATLTVTAGNASRAYGAPNPVLTASGAGALSSDSFTYTATTAAVPSSPLGTYSIVPAVTGANLGNYNVVYVDGTLTVGQATLTVTAGNASRAYGAPNPVLTASGAGALSSDSFTYTATTAAVPSSPLGTYSIVPAVTGANLGNYNVVYVDGTLTVGQATLTVTAGNASRAYGAPNPVLTASGAGALSSDSFTYTATTAAVPSSPLGTYSIVPAVTGANLANYNVVYVNGTLTVGQATLTVTAGNASRAYGAPNPVLTASGAGALSSDSFTYTATTAAVPSSPLGTYSIVPAVTGANLGNYNVVYVNGTLTVGQATLTVTAGNASRAYGAPNPVLTASGSGVQNGDSFTYTATTAAVPSSPLGTYSIVPAVTGANLGNYNVVYVDGTLTVGQATLTVTAGNASRAYGAPNPVLTASGSGVQNGDSFTYTATTAAVPSSPLGTYSIVPAVTGANLGNYNVVYVNGTLTVGQATLTVTAGNASRAYGAPNPVLTASGAGALSSDSFTYTATTAAVPSSPLGTYSIVPAVTGANLGNYNVVYVDGTLTVGQATLTVTAGNASRAYGAPNPVLTASGSGVQNGDSFTYTATTAAVPSSPLGTYSIVPAVTGANLGNYNVVYVNGTLTVGQATLTVTAGNASRAYGAPNPVLTASGAGALSSDSFTYTATTAAVPSSPLGTYSIVPAVTGANLGNYNVVYVDGTLTVGQATLTVTAGNASRAYGAPNPVLTASGSGVQNGDSFTYTATTAAVPSSPLGTYSIVPGVTGANLANYNVVYVDGTLTVGQATLTVTAGNASRAYGAPNPVLTASGAGALSSDSFTYTATTAAVPSSPLGTYSIVPAVTGANLGNYNVVYVNGTLTVGQATLTVTAGNASRAYGAPNPVLTASGAGALSSDSFTYTATTAAVPSSPLGTYSIVPAVTGANLGNYNVVYVDGTLTVGQATLTVTAGNANRVYGAPNPVLTASGSGVQNSDSFTYTATTTAVQSSPVGTYSIVPAVTGANLANYNVVYVDGTLTVGQATLTVTAGNASRAYGAPNPVLSASGSGVQNGDSFTYTATTTAVPSSPVGTYSIVPAVTGANLANYNVVYVDGTLTVGQATLTVTSGNASRAYGAPNPVLTASGSGVQNSDSFTYTATTTAVPSSAIGNYSIVPAVTGANLANYNVVYVDGTLTVGQATLTVTAGNASRAYGAANPVLTASGSGVQNSDSFTYTATTVAVPSSPVGTYSIVPAVTGANLANYNVVYVDGTLTVGQATPIITWAPPATISYDTPLSATQLDATASVPGTFTYTPTAGTILSAGLNQLSVSFIPTDAVNYTTQTATVNLTVTPSAPVINWADPASIIYGTALSSTQLDATAVQPNGVGAVAGTFVYSPAVGTILSTGIHPISVTFTPTDSSDYTTLIKTVSINVLPATLILSANDATKIYGAPNPSFTGTVTGVQNGDVFTESFTTLASMLSNTGSYPIVPSVSGLNLPFYLQTVNNGTLTITKASVTSTLTLSPVSVAYGLPVNMTLALQSTTSGTPTGTVSFFDNGNLIGTSPVTSGVATFSTTSLLVGNHVITTLYSGDMNFNAQTVAATSGSNTVAITPLDFSFQLTSLPTLHGVYGTSGEYTFHLAPIGGSYPGTVQFTIDGSRGPILATYTFSENSLPMHGGPADITLNVATRKLAGMEHPVDLSSRLGSIALSLFLIPLASARRLRKSGRKLARAISMFALLLLTLGGIASLTGCGSGYRSIDNPIVVIATSNGVQHTITIDYHIDASAQ